jgi:predicted O-methyltransferase YrrM
MGLINRAIEIIKKEGLKKFLYRFHCFFNNRVNLFYTPFAILRINKIKKNFKRTQDLEKLVDETMNYYFIAPAQKKYEILNLLRLLKSKSPRIILEIGTSAGGTLFLFSQIGAYDAQIISIDLPQGPFGGGYSFWRIPIYKAFAKENQKLYLLRKDSHKEETLEEVKKILNGNQLDFLFIDGDHTYEGVKKDFEMYSPLVKKEGIIAFHDINPGLEKDNILVPRFWSEIKNNFKYLEFIQDIDQKGYGIGVILK